MRVLYFAWLRERLNRGEEIVSPPAEIANVGQLLDWLSERDEAAELALQNRSLIRAAVDTVIATHETPVSPGSTVALFPPMTGG